MPDIAIVALAVVVVAAALTAMMLWQRRRANAYRRPVDDPETLATRGRNALTRMRDILDASIGMYLFRRLTGRGIAAEPSERPVDAAAILTQEELSHRIGVPGAPEPATPGRIIAAGAAATRPATAGAAATSSPTDRAPAPILVAGNGPRGRMLRDGAVAFIVLSVAIVFVSTFWPRSDGAVLVATGTPGQTALAIVEVTPSPTLRPTRAPTATPTAVVTPAPTRAPIATPAPTATPTASPEPTRKPAAEPTA